MLPGETQVAIVGGGAVGLCLACLLSLRGVACVVLERRTTPQEHSRAIGIHPPALHVLQTVGVAETLIAVGVQIGGGLAYLDKKCVGRIPLGDVDPVYPFVLTVPQPVTEAVLTARLLELSPNALFTGANVVSTEPGDNGTCLYIEDVDGGKRRLRARYVVACDGKHSALREAAGIPFRGGKYPDSYLMGDFADNTPFGTDAALFVTSGGIVESFPLPGEMRRWVARLPERMDTTDAHDLATIVLERTGFVVPVETCVWMSPFGIEYRLAATFYQNNLFLAGDAAHVVSPIGGQGMNLGFLDARALAEILSERLKANRADLPTVDAADYERARRESARTALRRAELNT
ncbi:MAG: FAD-dependent monooxygenase, partial [Armatimonadetes bacterium]|nr:FAD-dependent monooxygenase [Armatimonadota bacterium]